MASKKSNFHWNHPITRLSIRRGMNTLSADVKQGIQYDHFSARFDGISISNTYFKIGGFVQKIITTMFKRQLDVVGIQDVIYKEFNRLKMFKTIVEKTELLNDGVITHNSVTFQFFSSNFVFSLQTAKGRERTLQWIEKTLGYQDMITSIFKPIGMTLPVPKNSDKASTDIRAMRIKPLINEIIATALIAQMVFRNPDNFSRNRNGVYGTNIRPFISKDDIGGINFFTSYIQEYDKYTIDVANSIEKCNKENGVAYACGMDIKGYFDNIRHSDVANMLWESVGVYQFKNKNHTEADVRNIAVRFKEFVVNVLGFGAANKTGLTIESHTQHVLANLTMSSILNNTTLVGDTSLFMYVDDVILTGSNPDDLRTSRDIIRAQLKLHGHTFSNVKEVDIFDVNANNIQFKQLVRLPGTAYFEINDENVLNSEDFNTSNYQRTLNAISDLSTAFDKTGRLVDLNKLTEISQRWISIIGNDIVRIAKNNDGLSPMGMFVTDDIERHSNCVNNAKWVLMHMSSTYLRRVLTAIMYHTRQMYHPSIDVNVEKAKFFLRDVMFYANNRDTFKFSEAKVVHCISNISKRNEDTILADLQYMYLCINTLKPNEYNPARLEQLLRTFMVEVITKFPSKIKFAAAIAKGWLYRIKNSNELLTITARKNFVSDVKAIILPEESADMPTMDQMLHNPEYVVHASLFYFEYRMTLDPKLLSLAEVYK